MLGPRHPSTLSAAYGFATALGNLGKHKEAAKLFRGTIKLLREVLGSEHPSTVSAVARLAKAIACQGKHAESLAVYRSMLNAQTATLCRRDSPGGPMLDPDPGSSRSVCEQSSPSISVMSPGQQSPRRPPSVSLASDSTGYDDSSSEMVGRLCSEMAFVARGETGPNRAELKFEQLRLFVERTSALVAVTCALALRVLYQDTLEDISNGLIELIS